jgi:predicted house-cleaning NTP pyrophosphatase (Maf/HAM1 superfamily)
VQGVGGAFVESIEGCPTTVIGLPLPQVVRRLLECGVIAAESAQS